VIRFFDRVVAGAGWFFLWNSRFGVHGNVSDRSLRAACWTAMHLAMSLYTLASVLAFLAAGHGFMSWIDDLGLCAAERDSCGGVGVAVAVFFLVPSFAMSLYARQRYASFVSDKARGVEYFLYFLTGLFFFFAFLANFWLVTSAVSLLVQMFLWGWFFRKGRDLMPQS
jgi:hypothetical protein